MGKIFDHIRIILVCIAFIAGGIGMTFQLRNEYRFLLSPKKVTSMTIAGFDRQQAQNNMVQLTGKFRYRDIIVRKTIEEFQGAQVDKGVNEYLYPFFDTSSNSGIYIASRMEPAEMAARYGNTQQKVRGTWIEFTAEEKMQLFSHHQRAAGGSGAFMAEADAEVRRFLDAKKNGKSSTSAQGKPILYRLTQVH